MPFIAPDDRFDAVFIDLGMVLTDIRGRNFLFNRHDDLPLFFKRDLGIRNKGRDKECVGFTTLRTLYPCDLYLHLFILCLYMPKIVAVDGQTGGMPALAGELVDLDQGNN